MLTYRNKQAGQTAFEVTDSRADYVWVDVVCPDAKDCSQVIDEFSLDPKIIHDVGDVDELPRYERKKDVHYVFVRTAARTHRGQIVTTPLLMAVTSNALVTITPKETAIIEEAIEYAEEYDLPITDHKRLVVATMGAVINQYQRLISQTKTHILDIKHRLQHHEVGNHDFIQFVTIEDNLNEYRSCLNETLTLCERLMKNEEWQFTGAALEDLDDVRLHIRQLINETTSHAQTVASIRNAYSTISNNVLNQRMKTLTVFTVLITIPNVFYGMYGMNVALPFQTEGWAYGFIVLFTIVLVGAIYALAKRLRLF